MAAAGLLVLPIDVIPDFIPVLGYADDAILTVLVLRWVIRRAGPDALARNCPGTTDGYHALARWSAWHPWKTSPVS